jgi:tight adherence protein B
MALGLSAPEASTSSAWLIVGAIGLFGGLFLLTLLLFPGERVSKARLGIDKPRSMSDIGTRSVSAIEEALERYGKRADLGNALAVADISMKPAEFVAMVAVVAVVAGLVGLVLAGPIVGVLVAIVVCLAVRFYVREPRRSAVGGIRRPTSRRAAVGHHRTAQRIRPHAGAGVGRRGRRGTRSQRVRSRPRRSSVGPRPVGLDDRARRRMQSKDLEWVVSAIDINRDTGGNLSEILDRVSATIRERGRIARQVRTLTAEGPAVGSHPHGIPAVDARCGSGVRTRTTFELLTYGVGLVALVIAGILMILGGIWVTRSSTRSLSERRSEHGTRTHPRILRTGRLPSACCGGASRPDHRRRAATSSPDCRNLTARAVATGVGRMRQLGQSTRRMLPNALVDGLEVNLVQAGHPHGLDLPRLLGIKITLAAMAALTCSSTARCCWRSSRLRALFFLPDYWVLSVRDDRQNRMRGRCRRHDRPDDHLCRSRPGTRRSDRTSRERRARVR